MARTATGSGISSNSEKLTRSGAAQEIDGGVAGDARQPVRGFIQILELILALQRFDEGFLGQVLRVGNIAHDAVDQQEHAAHVVGHEAALRFRGERCGVVAGGARVSLICL